MILPQFIFYSEGCTIFAFSWGVIAFPSHIPFISVVNIVRGAQLGLLWYFCYIIAYMLVLTCIIGIYINIRSINRHKLIVKKLIIILSILYIAYPMLYALLYVKLNLIELLKGLYLILLFSPPFNLSATGVILGLWYLCSPPKLVEGREVIDVFRQIEMSDELSRMYRDLLEIYKVKYPHNPEGVLRYHIDRELRSEVEVDLALKKLMQKHKLNQ